MKQFQCDACQKTTNKAYELNYVKAEPDTRTNTYLTTERVTRHLCEECFRQIYETKQKENSLKESKETIGATLD